MRPRSESRLDQFLASALDEIHARGLTRRLSPLQTAQQVRVVRDGRSLLNFSSNDYLGLASHPALQSAAATEWERSGFGSGASRLICGTFDAHEKLDSTIANFKQLPAALSFSSGYAAAMGTIPALCGTGDVIILDKLSHACLIDAARLSGAILRVFPHNDMSRLESHLKWATTKHPSAKILVVCESIYSMDGDRAPLREIIDLKDRFGAWLFLDEAHAVGVIGQQGRGLADEAGLAARVDIHMGTLGKALGSHGAYIAGSLKLRDFLINRARSFIFSTSPPAPVAAASCQAIEIAASPDGDARRSALWRNLRALHEILAMNDPSSAILPILIGDESAAVQTSERLLAAGFLVPSIRFPTVARGGARLRVTLTADHSPEDIVSLAEALSAGLKK